jgi:hypothetical protein
MKLEKYIIGKFEENGIFNCVEKIENNEFLLVGRFEKYNYKSKNENHIFLRDNGNTKIN